MYLALRKKALQPTSLTPVQCAPDRYVRGTPFFRKKSLIVQYLTTQTHHVTVIMAIFF